MNADDLAELLGLDALEKAEQAMSDSGMLSSAAVVILHRRPSMGGANALMAAKKLQEAGYLPCRRETRTNEGESDVG